MDSNIILSYGSKTRYTVISNTFIDRFMSDANGGYLKVYVYLLRCHQDPTRTVTIASIAEALGEEQKYIRMAFKYWDEQGVISITKARNGQITNIVVRDLDELEQDIDEDELDEDIPDAPFTISAGSSQMPLPDKKTSVKKAETKNTEIEAEKVNMTKPIEAPVKEAAPVPERPVYSAATMMSFKNNYSDFSGLTKYLEGSIYKRPLSLGDLQLVCYFYEQLEFPTDLIGYLYDYCINTQKVDSPIYIEKVAMNWHSSGITNLEMAKHEVESFSSTSLTVKAALGLNEKLKPVETEMISRWSQEYGLSDELIREACNRAVLQTKNPSLKYINSIITDWHTNNVKSLDDIKKLDAEYDKKKTSSKANEAAPSRQPKSTYFQYPQRNYTDQELTDMEKRKLRQSKLCT